jgi:glycosyltransferase involved in cell wall biosynthesis
MEIISKENYSLFLNTSSSEGLPVSMMEAISNGIPIVATNVGGVSEIVNDVTGFLIPKDFDYHMFENALKFVFENISKSEVRREKIRCFWRENYCAEKNYNSFVNELNNL